MEAQLQILNDRFEIKMAKEGNIASRVTKNAVNLTSSDNFRWNVLIDSRQKRIFISTQVASTLCQITISNYNMIHLSHADATNAEKNIKTDSPLNPAKKKMSKSNFIRKFQI